MIGSQFDQRATFGWDSKNKSNELINKWFFKKTFGIEPFFTLEIWFTYILRHFGETNVCVSTQNLCVFQPFQLIKNILKYVKWIKNKIIGGCMLFGLINGMKKNSIKKYIKENHKVSILIIIKLDVF